jgi:hypothetical protein
MSFWIKHPRTKEEDTMLTAAIAGFVFCILFTAGALVAAWIKGDADYLKSVALIDAAILAPTVSAYTVRKYTDSKSNGNGILTKVIDTITEKKE